MLYAYYRVSTQTQTERNGIEMQIAEVEHYCREHEVTLDGAFKDEGVSGTVENRDGLIDLLTTVKSGDRILVQNTSRLWRDDNVKVLVHRELKKAGADIISIEQPNYTIYEKDPNSYLFNAIMEALDYYDRMSISMKLAKGRRARAKSGHKPCGVAPIGYRWNRNDIVVDKEKAAEVKGIFSLCGKFRGNLTEIVKECSELGYKSVRGNDFSVQAVKNILQNDFYIGTVTYDGHKISGDHEPIISKELFSLVNSYI